MVNGVLLWVYFAVGLVVPEPTVCYILSSGMCSWSRHTQQLSESSHWFPDLWSEGYYGMESQV